MARERIVIDHDQLIADNTATQYSESNVLTYTQALNAGHTQLDELFNDLVERLNIDTAEGWLLDIIGRIVGQPRIVIDATDIDFFGFAGATPVPVGYGDLNNPGLGGRFRDGDEALTGNKRLNDSEYRVFLKARIFKNNTNSTPEEIIQAFSFIFNLDVIVLQDAFPRTGFGKITFGRQLSAAEKLLLNTDTIIPKTAGVSYTYAELPGPAPFGFVGFPGALGYGDLNDPTVQGGTFAGDIVF